MEISHITRDGRGVAWGPDEELVIIEGVSEEDGVINIEISQVLSETVLARKVTRIRAEKQLEKLKNAVDSPYEIDGEDEYSDEDYPGGGDEDDDDEDNSKD